MGERTLSDGDAALGGQIRRARQAAQLTQQELAEKAALAQGDLSKIERGERGVGIEVLGRLADALRASWSYDGGRIVFRRRGR